MASQIFIESLRLVNFGPFYGENQLDFTTKRGEPINVLIGGKNGAGKTHLLRALYLAITGKTGLSDLKNVEAESGATRFNVEHLLNRKAKREGTDTCNIEIKVVRRDSDTGKDRWLKVCHTIKFRPNSPPGWKFSAESSGSTRPVEDEEQFAKLRDGFLPRHLAKFFFFDAEKGQNLQLGDEDIVKGVSRILGLWAFEELEDRMRELALKIQKDNKLTDGSSGPEQRLAIVNGKMSELQGTIAGLSSQIQFLTDDLVDARARLRGVEDDLKTIGAIDPEKLESQREKQMDLKVLERDIIQKLNAAWGGALPLFLLGRTRVMLDKQLSLERRRRDWEGRRETVAPRIPEIKKNIFNAPPKSCVLATEVRAYYEMQVEEVLKGLFDPPPAGVEHVNIFLTETQDSVIKLRELLLLHANTDQVVGLLSDADKVKANLDGIEHSIRKATQNAASVVRGAKLHEERGRLTQEIATQEQTLSQYEADRTSKQAEMIELGGQETTLTQAVQQTKSGQSLILRANQYRSAAEELRKKASSEMRAEINEIVGDLWIEIMGRKHEFTGMEFDSYWNCYLIRKSGGKVNWDDANTSAGQRQVRLVSFYEALRRLAQSVPPLVVDTPLGRLSKEVREHVLTRLYLSDEGHQSIILSTDSEIDPEGPLFKKVKKGFGRAYTLVPSGKKDAEDYEVKIEPDYFGESLVS
jgi:DNA sulfur modification protein DndD